MDITGKLVITAVDTPAVQDQRDVVGKTVLYGVVVKILIYCISTIEPASHALGFHGPGVLHPTRFVDIVNVEIAKSTATSPEKAVEALNLIPQFADPFRPRGRRKVTDRSMHPISSQAEHFTNFAVLDPIKQLSPGISDDTSDLHQP